MLRTDEFPAAHDATHAASSGIEHMEEEFRALEGVGRRRWILLLGALLVIAGAIWAAMTFVADLKPGARTIAAPIEGVQIELATPRNASVLTAVPNQFVWESISGRHDYQFSLGLADSAALLIERATLSSRLELTPEERSRLERNRTYVWHVRARSKDGAVLGTGHGKFELR